NLAGLGGNAFTMPGVDGRIYVNLGDHFGDPIAPKLRAYPASGQLLIHELTHAWQISHSTFLPGMVCAALVNQANNQVADDGDVWGPPGPDWGVFNRGAGGALVAQGSGGSPTPVVPFRRPKDEGDPSFRYIEDNARAGRT